MRGIAKTVMILLVAAALWPQLAWAVGLTSFETDDQDKKFRIVFGFDETVEAQVVSNYAANFVDIGIASLKVGRDLTRQDHEPANEETRLFFRYTRFQEIEGELHIRLYLGKYADPADVQVVQLDNRIEVELVKPFWKVPADLGVEEPAVEDNGFIPDGPATDTPAVTEADTPDETAPVDSAPVDTPAENTGRPDTGWTTPSFYQDSSPETDTTPADDTQAPVADTTEPDGDNVSTTGDVYGTTSLDDLAAGRQPGPSDAALAMLEDDVPDVVSQPVHDVASEHSYRLFDLEDVAVAQVQLRNQPFNEALMELVAGSGFNVIVDNDVSDEVMTLDFRQKDLSLKRALDLLSMVYGLTYKVEDDAIIISGK
ncbi:hypothetical protein JW859_07020 [bacterium]|nr:hypothetical protein [bacterium]